ncbi:phage tail length tape measure family protein [Sphingobium sp. LMA1-1-1.1]|uniref:phage tail length tape measure family protein n=1 Tax=Sphingobium sp. LMA1-1-1.1 TaxID=3135238 RepID=UPI003449BABC
MAQTARAVNLALRIVGIADAERDFKRVGDAGGVAFRQIEKEALDAEKAIIKTTNAEKTAAMLSERRRTARSEARALFPTASDSAPVVRRQRRDYVSSRVAAAEKIIDDAQGAQALENLATKSAAAEARLVTLGRVASVAAVGVSALAYGFVKAAEAEDEHEQAIARFNKTLALTGNVSGATAQELETFAEKAADSTKASEEGALKAAAALARVPGIARAELQRALTIAADLGDTPDDVVQQAEKMGAVLSALARNDVEELRKALGDDLNPEITITVMKLAEAGKTAEAQTAYMDALAGAVANNPDSLSEATDHVTRSFTGMLAKWSEGSGAKDILIGGLNAISSAMDWLSGKTEAASGKLGAFLHYARQISAAAINPAKAADIIVHGFEPQQQQPRQTRSAFASPVEQMLEMGRRARGMATDAAARALLAKPDTPKKSSGGGGGGKSDAQREAERLARESEQARNAADRVRQSNQEVIDSYKLRSDEAHARLGLEGDALEAVVRQQAIDAAARRISTELVEKEVTARRLAAKGHFDEAQARAEATAIVDQQTVAVRRFAAAEYDAEQAQKQFIERQRIATQLFEETRTPLEKIAQEVANVQAAFDSGAISAFTFSRRMKQLAEDYVDLGRMGNKMWEGFGQDVGRTLTDIIRNGGSARDILSQLIDLPLQRLLQKNIEEPVAKFIDGITGNDVAKNVAKAKSDILPGLPQQLGIQAEPEFLRLTTAAGMAADALTRVAAAGGSPIVDPLADVGVEANRAAEGMNAITAQSGQLGSAFNSLIAMATGGSVSGGGGLLGTIIGLGSRLVGPAIGGGVTSAGTDAVYGGTLGGIYHDGGRVGPGGKQRMLPFDVSALPRLHNGTLRNDEFLSVLQLDEEVLNRSQARAFRTLLKGQVASRFGGGGGGAGQTIINNWNVPATPDRRRTGAEVARRQAEQQDDFRRRGLA